MTDKIEVSGHAGVFVRRLSFREFGRMRQRAAEAEASGDPSDVAFAAALVSLAAVNEDGSPIWPGYEDAANDTRPLFVSDVVAAAVDVNGLGADSGNE